MQWLGCYNKLSCGHSDQRLSTLCFWPGKLHIHAFLFVLSSRPLSTIFKFRSVSVFLFMRLLLFPGFYFLFYSLSTFFYFHCIFFVPLSSFCLLSSIFIWSIFPFLRLLLFSGFFWSLSNSFYFRWISSCSFVSPFLLALQDSRCIYFPFSMIAFIFSFLSFLL